jgi:hypothetical protein
MPLLAALPVVAVSQKERVNVEDSLPKKIDLADFSHLNQAWRRRKNRRSSKQTIVCSHQLAARRETKSKARRGTHNVKRKKKSNLYKRRQSPKGGRNPRSDKGAQKERTASVAPHVCRTRHRHKGFPAPTLDHELENAPPPKKFHRHRCTLRQTAWKSATHQQRDNNCLPKRAAKQGDVMAAEQDGSDWETE